MADSNSKAQISYSRSWPWFFLTAAFESLIAAAFLLSVPSESGLSPARLVVLFIISTFFAAGLYGWHSTRGKQHKLDAFAATRNIGFLALLSLLFGLILFLLRYLDPEKLLPYYERISPLLWLLLILAAQASLFLLLLKNGFHPKILLDLKRAFPAFGVLFSLFLFVVFTKIGIKPDSGYWGEPGVPVQLWQFILALIAGFCILLLGDSAKKVERAALPLLLYLTALTLWLSVPEDVLQNSFYAPITPPVYQPFPYSDAGFYDSLAQSLLIGADYFDSIPPRPLYVVFLAGLHVLFGQNYQGIIAAQTAVLAFFPVILYFLGKKLHSPSAGVVVALFVIFRELVTLWVSSNIRVSNSKMLTTDFPTAMGIAVLCLVIILWLERRDFKSTLVAGGMFGLLLLFRTQSLLTLPFIFILAWFAYQKNIRAWFWGGVIFGSAMLVTVLPWLLHNREISGKLAFDDPRQVAVIYSQYSFEGNLDISQFDPEKDSVGQRLVSFTLANPGFVANFIVTHMINTEISGLLAMPLIKDYDGLFAPVNLYWPAWTGELESYNIGLMILYLFLLALGLSVAWRKLHWVGLVPLAFNLGYVTSNGISRFSGWRYNLLVDWVVYFYIAVGIAESLRLLSLVFTSEQPQTETKHKNSLNLEFKPKHLFLLLPFILTGFLPWAAKSLVDYRFLSAPDALMYSFEKAGYEKSSINGFLTQPNAVILEGRMLYPRLYRRYEGMSSANPWPAYKIRDYARIGFLLINDESRNAIFQTRDVLDFTHGADVTLLGCQMEDYIDVRVILFGGRKFESAPLTLPCP